MNRRDFLKASATSVAGLAFPSIIKAATPWAVLPDGDMPKYKILEIFLPGGASQWENFWVSHDGPPSQFGNNVSGGNLNWRGLESKTNALQWQNCAHAPSSSLQTMAFGTDANGTNVSWGPAVSPLWRSDIINRSRMVVTKHGDELHFGAGYRTLTGRRFGSPRGAGLGTAIQRHYQSLEQQQDIPYSYTFAPDHLAKDYFFNYPTLLGQHPGPSRPLGVKVGIAAQMKFQRAGISSAADGVFDKLRDQYRDLLRWQGAGNPVNSADFETYDSSSNYLIAADALDEHLGGQFLAAEDELACTHDPEHTPSPFGFIKNRTQRSVEAAAYMLNNGAKHITLIDGGFYSGALRDSSTPYDTHGNGGINHAEATSAHLFNLCKSLANVIGTTPLGALAVAPLSIPKIDLDETLIIIHTEFNRTPAPVSNSNGRNHFPYANVAVLLGGPISSRGIHGSIALEADEPESAIAVNPLTPTDVHAAVLYAAGVNPIDADNFTEGDAFSAAILGNGTGATQIRQNLKTKVLGITDFGLMLGS